jgi:outer membrane biogenesis lipoprotein LolB
MIKKIIFLAAVLLLVSACSDDDKGASENKGSGDHVWKEQTQVIDKAKEVEGLLKDASDQQSKIIDEQTK